MFAALVLEREPARWADLWISVLLWIQNAGAVATIGLVLGGLSFLVRDAGFNRKLGAGRGKLFLGLAGTSMLLYAVGLATNSYYATISTLLLSGGGILGIIAILLILPSLLAYLSLQGKLVFVLTLAALVLFGVGINRRSFYFVAAGGIAAIAGACVHLLPAVLMRFRLGRIWAIARLSIKEAVRSRIILIFSVMAGIFLFADWFVPYRAEDQVRNYVRVIYWTMTPLFLMTACLLGAFNIPNEVRNQSIHTIVTKPVQRFEIVLGRFLGYGIVLTLGLAILSCMSLLYLVRGVHPDAARESYTARVPVFCDSLSFWGTKDSRRGENVGRMWDYRSYIAGRSGDQGHYAIWSFNSLPSWLGGSTQPIKFELTFDIFRLRKGEKEREGLYCTFAFMDSARALVDGQFDARLAEAAIAKLRDEERKKKDAVYSTATSKRNQGENAAEVAKWSEKELAAIDAELLDKHRTYVISGYKVIDYETQELTVPPRLFTALANTENRSPGDPPLIVVVSVERSAAEREAMGMLGVAKYDFYLLAAERPFWINFLKGLIGMWCSVMLILGLALACSTYFNGVISLLCAIFIFALGIFPDYLRMIASGRAPGGGPLEAAHRLINRAPEAAPLDDTPGISVLRGVDSAYRWVLDQFLMIIPDINRYDLHNYVANGFDISWGQVLLLDNFLYLVAYLFPWAVLAYYLMEFREIANPS